MKITLICSLLLFTTVTFAQETIIRDTINLRGYIYQIDGKPANILKLLQAITRPITITLTLTMLK